MSPGQRQKVKRSSVQRIFDILELLALESGSLRSSQIARTIGISKPTVHRLLKALEHLECVRADDSKYSLGPRLLYLGEKARTQLQLVNVSRPIINKLAGALGETVSLGTLHHDHVLIIETVKPMDASILFANLGPIADIHCSALGKALLAQLPRAQIDAILMRLVFEPRTKNTITELKQFRRELELVRRKGIAYDREETELGLFCIGVCIRDSQRQPIAALSASGPVMRMLGSRHSKIEDAVFNAVSKIETVLGSSGMPRESQGKVFPAGDVAVGMNTRGQWMEKATTVRSLGIGIRRAYGARPPITK
jgi:IclR family transcriptional regulator, acetate operon repressor